MQQDDDGQGPGDVRQPERQVGAPVERGAVHRHVAQALHLERRVGDLEGAERVHDGLATTKHVPLIQRERAARQWARVLGVSPLLRAAGTVPAYQD